MVREIMPRVHSRGCSSLSCCAGSPLRGEQRPRFVGTEVARSRMLSQPSAFRTCLGSPDDGWTQSAVATSSEWAREARAREAVGMTPMAGRPRASRVECARSRDCRGTMPMLRPGEGRPPVGGESGGSCLDPDWCDASSASPSDGPVDGRSSYGVRGGAAHIGDVQRGRRGRVRSS